MTKPKKKKPRVSNGATREGFTAAEQLAFMTEVGGRCPRCNRRFFYAKGERQYKKFELAHIFPLHPTLDEQIELADLERMHANVNHPYNIIALCTVCHTEFDNPRTAEEYLQMVRLKKELIQRAEQQDILSSFPIEAEVKQIVDGLYKLVTNGESSPLSYDPKSIQNKLDQTITEPTKQKIRVNVASYYQYVRAAFVEREVDSPGCSELISHQVRAFFLKQRQINSTQQRVFESVVAWINAHTKPQSIEAAEIVASYYIQNCEVFE